MNDSPRPAVPGSKRRWRQLLVLERWVEPVMIALGLLWLALLLAEFVWGTTPSMSVTSNVIWVIFVIEFLVRMLIAPRRWLYFSRNWLTVLALVLPAFRVLRVVRALRLFRATRSLRLVRLLTSTNRGLRSLGSAMQRRGAGYVGLITLLIVSAGAAGMFVFEREALPTYSTAWWWTSMLVTTLGSEYWPQSSEGRILCLLLSVYAVGVFGYLAATLASILVGRNTQSETESVTLQALRALQGEVQAMRAELQALKQRSGGN